MEKDPNCNRKDDHTYFPQENIQSCPRENVNVMREVWVSDVSSFSSMKNDSFTSKYSHANSSKIKTLINPKENDKLCSYNKSDCFMRVEQKVFLLDFDKKGSARSGFNGMLIILLTLHNALTMCCHISLEPWQQRHAHHSTNPLQRTHHVLPHIP